LSQRSSGYNRVAGDFYATPRWVTEALLGHISTKPGSVWEPACGELHMVQVLKDEFHVIATDVAYGPDDDFLKFEAMPTASARGIITNPPYNLATEFCEKSLELTKPIGGFVAMLLRCDFDHAKTRAHLFADCPAFAKKIVLTRRIVWFVEDDGKPKASPSFNHAWYLWDHAHSGPPTIAYEPR
jgi:hypothetical protein